MAGTGPERAHKCLRVLVFLLIGLLALTGPTTYAVVAMVHLGRDIRELQVSVLLTWAALRGGISLGLALSLPAFEQREVIQEMAFAVVVFSLLVQGLAVGRLYSQEQLRHLTELRDLGRRSAESWLAEHFDDLGVRSTFDISFVFEESLRPAHLAEQFDESLRHDDRSAASA